jgi:DNA-binding transcriptional MerR regulator
VRIGELARTTGTTTRALRHYERSGLIHAERAANGYRVYGAGQATRVRNIRHLLAAGLTLDDVHLFAACLDGDVTAVSPSPLGLRIARARLAVLDARIDAHIRTRDQLRAALTRSPWEQG